MLEDSKVLLCPRVMEVDIKIKYDTEKKINKLYIIK